MKWSFALTPDGDLHIIPHEMPSADNLVTVEIVEQHGMHVIRAADLNGLRRLLTSPEIERVVQHEGATAADELDDLLTAIHRIVEKRTAVLRGEEP